MDAESRNSVPYGAGDQYTHCTGRLGELVFARFLHVTADPDYSLQADRSRGCDLTGPDGTRWHIRASRHHDAGLMIKPGDPPGNYVLVITAAAPRCYIIGWYTRSEAEAHHILQPMRVDRTRKIWEIPQGDLHPFYQPV